MIEVERSSKNFPAKVHNNNKLICSNYNSTSFYNNPSSGVTNVTIIVQKKPSKRTKPISVPEKTTAIINKEVETVFINKNIVEIPLLFSVSQQKQSVFKENITKIADSMQISKNTKSQNGRFGKMNNSSFLNIASSIIIQHLKTFENLNKGSNDKVIVPFSIDLEDNRSSQYLLLECIENESSDDSVNDYLCEIDTIQSSCSGSCAYSKCVNPKIVDASLMVSNMSPDRSCEFLKKQDTNGDCSPMLLLLDDEIGNSEDSLCSSVYVQISENFSQINSTFSIYGTETSVSTCRVPPCNGKPVHYIDETKKFMLSKYAKQRETSSHQSPLRRLNYGEGQIGYLNQNPYACTPPNAESNTPQAATAIKKPNLVPQSYKIKSQTSKLPAAEKDHSPHRVRVSPQAIVTKKLYSPKTPKFEKSCTCEMSAGLNFPTKSNCCLQPPLRQIQTLAPVQPLPTSESSSQMQMLERALRPSALDPQAAFNINPLTYATFSRDIVLYPCASTQCSSQATSSCLPGLVKAKKLQSTATSPMCLPKSYTVPQKRLTCISNQAQPRCMLLKCNEPITKVEVGCQTCPYNHEDSISCPYENKAFSSCKTKKSFIQITCPCKKKKVDCQICPFNDIYETIEKCTCEKDKALGDSKTCKKKKNKKKNHSCECPLYCPAKDVEPRKEPRKPLSIQLFVPSPYPSSCCSHSSFPPVHSYIRISNPEEPSCMLSKSTDVIIKVEAGCQICPYNDAYTITESKKCQEKSGIKVGVKKRQPISQEEICFEEALRCVIEEQEKEDCRPTQIDDACKCCEEEKSCYEKKDACTCLKGNECSKIKKTCKCNKKKDGCECFKGKVICKCYKKNKNVKCECPRCDSDCPIRTKQKKAIDNRINYTISLLPPQDVKDCNECCKEVQEVKKVTPVPEGIRIQIRGKGSGSKGLNDLFCFDVQVADKSTMPQLTVI